MGQSVKAILVAIKYSLICSYLFLLVLICSYLFLLVLTCSYLFLLVLTYSLTCTYLFLFVLSCSYLFLLTYSLLTSSRARLLHVCYHLIKYVYNIPASIEML